MSRSNVQEEFLVIGRKRRVEDKSRINSLGRYITGKKGLGKLALFGIGKKIEIVTSKTGETYETKFILDWNEILNETKKVYHPKEFKTKKSNSTDHGTSITLTNLSRTSGFDLESIAVSLSKLFNCFDTNFVVRIHKNDGDTIQLTKELKYKSIDQEFKWDVNEISLKVKSDYLNKYKLVGKIISTEKPIKSELRGITIYVNGRLANKPSFFDLSEAGYPFSYITGWVDANYLDECSDDLISTDRQSLSWDMPETNNLKKHLQKIIRFIAIDWGKKRNASKKKKIEKMTGVNINKWYKTLPDKFRDSLTNIVDTLYNKSEINPPDFTKVVKNVHDLVPEYPLYHYRHLHEEIKKVAFQYYKNKDYYTAFTETMKKYKNSVKDKADATFSNDCSIMSSSFGNSGLLTIMQKYRKRPNGKTFTEDTIKGIEEGQKFLSMGVAEGARNPLSHEEVNDLKVAKLFTENDCLDLLSLLSHLFKVLDISKKRKK